MTCYDCVKHKRCMESMRLDPCASFQKIDGWYRKDEEYDVSKKRDCRQTEKRVS